MRRPIVGYVHKLYNVVGRNETQDVAAHILTDSVQTFGAFCTVFDFALAVFDFAQ